MSDFGDLVPLAPTVEHLDEIRALLDRTWPALYGASGCPRFSRAYLDWLYGGPLRDRHLLLGHRARGRLVGFKAYLFRPLRCGGAVIRGYIATHLTIDPALSFAQRAALAAALGRSHVVGDRAELSLAYFEDKRGLAQSVDRRLRSFGLVSTETAFRHAIVNPRRLRSAAAAMPAVAVRAGRCADAEGIVGRLEVDVAAGLVVQPTARALWHHLSQAPGGRVFVVERDGRVAAALGCYVLDWLKDGRTSRLVVVELALVDEVGQLAGLLLAAANHAEASGARGVVFENSTYLSGDLMAQVGITPIPRVMTLAVRGRDDLPDLSRGFLCDVK